jgi:hypothetical protein
MLPQHAGNHHRIGDDLGDAQGADEFDDLGDIAVFVELDSNGLKTGGLGISQKPILVQMP